LDDDSEEEMADNPDESDENSELTFGKPIEPSTSNKKDRVQYIRNT